MSYLLYGAALVGAFLLEESVRPPAENHPVVVGVALGVVFLVVGVLVWLLAAPAWIATFLILMGGCGWGWIAGWDSRDNYLTPYCEYAATSRAQVERCLDDVNAEDVDRLDTPAARFARGETTECGAGAGPLCED